MKRWTFTLLVLLWCIVAIIYATFFSPSCRADQQPCDCDGTGNVTITDVVALINYIFNDIEPPRNEWVEVDTTVSVVWILDRAFTVANYPITVQKHYYVAGLDTTWLREYVITDAEYWTGNPLIRVR